MSVLVQSGDVNAVKTTNRPSSTVDCEETLDIDQGPTSHQGDMNPPRRQLVTKLLEQNARLKNIVRQLIAHRGFTVAQYLVCVTRYSL